ncbi:protein maelstrom homolog isoform X1 [Folsomia candida]|uniref:protein maelstrom homolog isoform X1 n=1 Tax=Folsomia candida TaxID=158441 RepID=UPI000B904772|nr:protein maelstrom homolog isoform X1 [Folsomia candida]
MPPKQKKQPRNAYYFYMLKRKEELEREGYRFLGGMKDVANAVGSDWAAMTPEEKVPYEEEARKSKEEGKQDLTNKYTSAGESYAQVQRRLQDDKQFSEEQEQYITELGTDAGALDRVFVLIKTNHCVEQIIERNQRIYWPIEVGMVAFKIRDGLQSIYWSLVDTQKTPVGYASAAKECSEETGLPEPGMASMQEYRDYNKIMNQIEGFIRHWTKSYKKGPVVFALDQETEYARGCLKWLASHVDGDKRMDHQSFVDTLKFYKLPKLILRLASFANRLNPSYNNVLVKQKLELSAASIVNKGCYDYKDEITCVFHQEVTASLKMYTCCRNVVLRRMYLIFEEFLPAFCLAKTDRHDMEKLKQAQIAKAAKAKADCNKRAAAGGSPEGASPSSPSFASGGSWGASPPPRRDSGKMLEDDVSGDHHSLGRYSKRKHDQAEDCEREGPQSKRDSFSSDPFHADRLPRDSPSPPPAPTYRRLGRLSPTTDDFMPAPSAEYVPWGNKRPTAEPTFSENDFPSLGALQTTAPMPKGAGRGRGAPERSNTYDNDTYKRDGDARQYY